MLIDSTYMFLCLGLSASRSISATWRACGMRARTSDLAADRGSRSRDTADEESEGQPTQTWLSHRGLCGGDLIAKAHWRCRAGRSIVAPHQPAGAAMIERTVNVGKRPFGRPDLHRAAATPPRAVSMQQENPLDAAVSVVVRTGSRGAWGE